MRKPLIGLLTVVLLFVAIDIARAVPPPEQQPPEQTTRAEPPQFLRPIEGETSIGGMVMDQTQNPMSGVQVKLFVDGLNVASTTTDLAGSYDLRYPIDIGKDKTVILWYVAPGTEWVPKAVVLHESRAAISARLISSCIPRVQVNPFLEFNVQMVDVATRNKQIAKSGCLSPISFSQ
ncbi:MAG: hypothetical protein AMJ46_01185 [Latescibacteria bacterium DG_63]|nr:MAG: hypothetical protein AMJ46_01185 [Latescibacteria bacterium DG_63]